MMFHCIKACSRNSCHRIAFSCVEKIHQNTLLRMDKEPLDCGTCVCCTGLLDILSFSTMTVKKRNCYSSIMASEHKQHQDELLQSAPQSVLQQTWLLLSALQSLSPETSQICLDLQKLIVCVCRKRSYGRHL